MTEPRILEPDCEWTSADVGDADHWTEQLTDTERQELRLVGGELSDDESNNHG